MPPERSNGHEGAGDAQLLLAVAARDRSAFIELFGRYGGRIKGLMIRQGSSPQDADEIAQEVMVSIWRRAATFDPERAGAATWIFAIARNRRIDMIRKTRRPAPDPEDPLFQPDPEPDGLETLTAAEREVQVRAVIRTLPEEQRRILMAAFYDGLSHGEIAERFGLPLGTVKSRIRLAFRSLRGSLEPGLGEGLTD
jgi:RNA polymerase sigma-70 factor (ECF subfamily)